MGQEVEEIKVRSIKKKVEDNSKLIEQLVDKVVDKYSRELDDYVHSIKQLLDTTKDDLTDMDIEYMSIKVPLFMYFAANGMETIGIQCDNAKAIKMEKFNEIYMVQEGTIQDKTSVSENLTLNEHIVEVIYSRAYKKLKSRLDTAEQLCNSIRKVLQKRISEVEISRYEKSGAYEFESDSERSNRNGRR